METGNSKNRCVVALCFLMGLPILARPQATSTPASRQVGEYTIKVDADSVVLHATAQNHSGVLVSGLSKDDFQVYENGVLQQIQYFSHEDIPVTVGLVVDNSGSMKPKRAEVIEAALAFARSSNPQDQMFVVNFNEHVSFGLPPDVPFTDQADQLRIALSRIRADGETALYDALAVALQHLAKGNRDKRVLVVISDGADNASHDNLAQIMAMARQSDAIIYALGLFVPDDPDRNPHVLTQLAKATGGEAFMPEDLKEVTPICERIAQDIRNQYTLAYAPTDKKQDGAYRVILVKAEAAGHGRVFVRTRAGYYAPLKSQLLPAASATAHELQN
jgi:Ca-activated chloride channel homolog